MAASEEGIAMVVMMLAITLLSVIGALTILVAASSLQGMVNMRPEDKSFRIAETGLAWAHVKIVNNQVVGSPYVFAGTAQGGDYMVTISGSTPDWTVVSEATYVEGGATYRRKLQEEVTYYGDQAFDVMRNYVLFAGHDLTIDVDDLVQAGVPMTINGNIRAQNQTTIHLNPLVGIGSGFTINGRVEGQGGVYLDSVPSFLGLLSDMKINGDVLSNGTARFRANGTWLLLRLLGWINLENVKANTIVEEKLNGSGIRYSGTKTTGWSGMTPVYIPRPNMEYYKSLAQDQGNYFVGNKVLSGNLGAYGNSSVTVIYATGNMTLNGFTWDQPNMKGIFVCEGDFTANNTLQFLQNSRFQAIAGGNMTFNSSWDFLGFGSSNQFFFWSGNNVRLNMGMFSGLKLQVTAMNDILVDSDNLLSTCTINYAPPDIDVGGFPIDVTVNNWKELPSE